ncbi:MAG: ureidoglycolate lyase [Verrucomicrobiales bacterium]|nr:ureidoglycolate lyase [Verrucomicrobiales bacterium]
MKLIRVGNPGEEKPGVLREDGTRVDVSAFGEDYGESFFGTDGPARLTQWLEGQERLPTFGAEERLGPAVARPSKLICIGLNYKAHAEEGGMELPPEPVIFFKATSAIVGPNDDIVIPRDSEKTDWEVELAFVIGKKASYVEEANALNHVAGYVLHNDYSERAFQLERHGQWVKGKSCDTFAPIGPYVATTDEVPDPQALDLWLKVNGEMLQNSNTNDMAYGVQHLVHYLSQFMTLLPGDVISTGTPSGVGLGFDPPRFLRAGDVVELGITGLGESRQKAVAAK